MYTAAEDMPTGSKGEWDNKAIADFTEAIRFDPKSVLAYCHRGLAYAMKGDNDKAITDCTEAIRLDPKMANAYAIRGNAYKSKGESAKADADFAQFNKLSQQPK